MAKGAYPLRTARRAWICSAQGRPRVGWVHLLVRHHAGQGADDAVQDLNPEDDQPAELIETGRLHPRDDVVGASEVLSQPHTIKFCDRSGDMGTLPTSVSIST